MSQRVKKGSRILGLGLALLLAAGLTAHSAGWPDSGLVAPALETANTMDHVNLMGYEGIPVLGDTDLVHGAPPPVADWVTTHCRFIDHVGHNLQDYILRYPVRVPDNAVIEYIQLRVADFAQDGQIWVYLRSRLWNSRDSGTQEALDISGPTISDQTLNLSNLNLKVDNTNRTYWIDVAPAAADLAGELCVYSVHIAYTLEIFADGFESGDTSAWATTVP